MKKRNLLSLLVLPLLLTGCNNEETETKPDLNFMEYNSVSNEASTLKFRSREKVPSTYAIDEAFNTSLIRIKNMNPGNINYNKFGVYSNDLEKVVVPTLYNAEDISLVKINQGNYQSAYAGIFICKIGPKYDYYSYLGDKLFTLDKYVSINTYGSGFDYRFDEDKDLIVNVTIRLNDENNTTKVFKYVNYELVTGEIEEKESHFRDRESLEDIGLKGYEIQRNLGKIYLYKDNELITSYNDFTMNNGDNFTLSINGNFYVQAKYQVTDMDANFDYYDKAFEGNTSKATKYVYHTYKYSYLDGKRSDVNTKYIFDGYTYLLNSNEGKGTHVHASVKEISSDKQLLPERKIVFDSDLNYVKEYGNLNFSSLYKTSSGYFDKSSLSLFDKDENLYGVLNNYRNITINDATKNISFYKDNAYYIVNGKGETIYSYTKDGSIISDTNSEYILIHDSENLFVIDGASGETYKSYANISQWHKEFSDYQSKYALYSCVVGENHLLLVDTAGNTVQINIPATTTGNLYTIECESNLYSPSKALVVKTNNGNVTYTFVIEK